MEYWRFVEDSRIRWWWLAGALVLWGTSTWLLTKTLEALARRSPSLKFVGWFTFAGVALIIASFVFAAHRADIICDEIRTWNNEPRWFPVVWAVPALVVALVALVTHFEEVSLRDQWGEVALTLITTGALGALMVVGIFKVAKLVNK